MSKTHRKEPKETPRKPRQLKRQRQREAMELPLTEYPKSLLIYLMSRGALSFPMHKASKTSKSARAWVKTACEPFRPQCKRAER